jgi:Endonuclease/Exonuclease/phosphatase family
VDADRFAQMMLIDGNDERGIDVGVMTKPGFELSSMCSHVDDADSEGQVFSRDCPEYTIATAAGNQLTVLVNHFKSKGYGRPADSNAKRRRQAVRVAEIYARLRADGQERVAVLGDLNDTPDSKPLAPLLQDTDLKDIAEHRKFSGDGRPGTHGNGTKSSKFDYLLLSPAVFDRVAGGGVFRKGVWGGKHGTLWEIYPTMSAPQHAASDHAAIYADTVVLHRRTITVQPGVDARGDRSQLGRWPATPVSERNFSPPLPARAV